MTENDTSPDHFDWLVHCRSLNQASTTNVYRIVRENEDKLNRYAELQRISQTLVGIAFSLWRSVFLSDVSDDTESQRADLNKFLISLIADNTVLYQTDKNARNWSFRYYLENAESRLERMSGLGGDVLSLIGQSTTSEKQRWLNAQKALDSAIDGFRAAVNAAPSVPR